WAMRAEGLKPSPIGLLVHPRYGPWHAFRGALLFDRQFDFPVPRGGPHPCDECTAKPCLDACPVGAFTPAGFAVVECRQHLADPAGRTCRERGCLARNACPVGAEF